MSTKTISLNLIYDYPVKWSKYKVLRDFIQNFYDAVDYNEFHKRFSYKNENQCLELKITNIGFSYEWLIHIGASTKREDKKFAGFFGEGFKIASLCALRDYDWQIQMSSKNWHLKVITQKITVDSKRLTSLAYEITYKQQESKDTILSITPLLQNDMSTFKSALLSFFYPENELFSTEIWSSEFMALYERSTVNKPYGYPDTYDYYGEGIVFTAYQALGSLNLPLIFCIHDYKTSDRERNTLYKMNVIDVIFRIACEVPPSIAYYLLKKFRRYWNSYPKRKYDFESYYKIINQLTNVLSKSVKYQTKFKDEFPNLLVCEKLDRKNIRNLNRRRQALDWKTNNGTRYLTVQDGFLQLGFPTLEEVCEKHDGFSLLREPNSSENIKILILTEVAQQFYTDFFCNVTLPEVKIIENNYSAWNGLANMFESNKYLENSYGLKIKYHLNYIAIQAYLLHDNQFSKALGTYLHELAHMFGGDQSKHFSFAMSCILDIMITNAAIIDKFHRKWKNLDLLPEN